MDKKKENSKINRKREKNWKNGQEETKFVNK
jgi:hypothetical protein